MSNVLIIQQRGPSILLRIIWFLIIGWWLGGIVSAVAWLLCIIIIGMPLGFYLLNRLPGVITLRAQEQGYHIEEGVLKRGQKQRPFLWRVIYYVLIGWWFSALWLGTAFLCVLLCVIPFAVLLFMPIAFWMYGRVGAVLTLYRS